jgi:hypothetical protein
MDIVGLVWAATGVAGVLTFPAAAARTIAHRSGEAGRSPDLLRAARVAVAITGTSLVVFLGLSAWFLLRGEQPF